MQTQIAAPKAASPIRVLVVDDHVLWRQGMRVLLNEEQVFEVVGEGEEEQGALSLTIELQPDIVLVDIGLGTSGGLDVAKQLLRTSPETRIVLFAGSNDEQLLFDAVRIGVHGYLQKTLSIEDLSLALRAVKCGDRVLGETQAVIQVVIEVHRLATEQNRLDLALSTADIEVVPI